MYSFSRRYPWCKHEVIADILDIAFNVLDALFVRTVHEGSIDYRNQDWPDECTYGDEYHKVIVVHCESLYRGQSSWHSHKRNVH